MALVTSEPPVRARRAADPEALASLYDELAPALKRFLVGLRLPLPRQDLEDALQETFLRLMDRLSGLDPGRAVLPYALGIARHVALDLCRRGPPPPAPQDPDETRGEASTSDRVSRLERAGLIDDALAALDPELRSVLALRHVSGVTMLALADALGCSVPTARARLREAAHRFAVELRRRGIAPVEVCR